ncbi:response regulator [Candidatus Rhabdochlamydia oedothoracis]|uniref:response regulator n=1 Tax=Candidatus Rhabdochlamydia oedothoracis TaxID=2720720 RepID=UPI001C652740|nr:response regulator [Candidatus Rhabdochlamydia oedothoracis]
MADSDRKLHQRIKQAKEAAQYHFEFAASGTEVLKKMPHFQPDLVVVELVLPHIHGIEGPFQPRIAQKRTYKYLKKHLLCTRA